jgi:hypothetical protein
MDNTGNIGRRFSCRLRRLGRLGRAAAACRENKRREEQRGDRNSDRPRHTILTANAGPLGYGTVLLHLECEPGKAKSVSLAAAFLPIPSKFVLEAM